MSQETGPGISSSTVSVPPARRYSNATSHNYSILPVAIKATGSLELGGYMLDATSDNTSTPRDKGKYSVVGYLHVKATNITWLGNKVFVLS